MSYELKYLKYKNKYLKLKSLNNNLVGGTELPENTAPIVPVGAEGAAADVPDAADPMVPDAAQLIIPPLVGYDFNSVQDFIRYIIRCYVDLLNIELTAPYWSRLVKRFLNFDRATIEEYNVSAPPEFPSEPVLRTIIDRVNAHAFKNEKEFHFIRLIVLEIQYPN